MGISSPDVGYRGYWLSNDIIDEDLTEYSVYTTAWLETATGIILTDMASAGKLRFKVSLKHTVAVGRTIYFRLLVGGVVVWEKSKTGNAYSDYTTDLDVTWRRGDVISCQISLDNASGTGGKMKDFKICGYLTSLGLN